jgi:FMNH2-dependent dimethyl sulfone monooxygenase
MLKESSNNGLKLGIFMPNCSYGYTASRIETTTDWTWDYNKRVALLAEELGFDFLVPLGRWRGHGRGPLGFEGIQLEVTTWAAALAAVTKRIKVFSTIHTGVINPLAMAKMGATIDHISDGRWGLNVVSGGFHDEYEMMGIPWLEHDERYAMSIEAVEVMLGLWTNDRFDYNGRYYKIRDGYVAPKPVQKPHPTLMQAGYSEAAKKLTAKYCDLYFINAPTIEFAKPLVEDMKERSGKLGRSVVCATHCYVLCRSTEAEARSVHQRILALADQEAMKDFMRKLAPTQAVTGTALAGIPMESLVFGISAHPLIGTAKQVAEGIKNLYDIGMGAILCVFLNYLEDLAEFGREVLPLLEKIGVRKVVN